MRAIATLLSFLVINLLLTRFNKPPEFDHPTPSYSRLPQRTDVTFLGSSVIATPIHFLEREISSSSPNVCPFEVRYVESQLSNLEGKKSSVWSLAVPGQMLDESSLVFSQMLEAGKSPCYLILGIAPVALLESTKTSVLTQSNSSGTQGGIHSILNRFKGDIRSLALLYTERRETQGTLIKELARLYDQIGLTEPECMRWQRGLNDYVGRYANCQLSQRKFDQLEQIAKRCQQNSTQLIIVSAPLHKDNRALMKFSYESYSKRLQNVAYGCKILDLGEKDDFQYQDYFDPAHLNAQGGKKMLKMILTQIHPKTELAIQ
jgi:hypothetical protein